MPDQEEPVLAVSAVKLDGPPQPAWKVAHGSCGGTPRCVGSYEVTFSWPEDVPSGRVRVEWSVSAVVVYEASEPPEGARLDVTIEPPAGGVAPPTRFFDDELVLDPRRRVIARDIRVRSERPIRASIALERDALEVSPPDRAVRLVLLEAGREPVGVRRGFAAAVHPPSVCARRSCTFSFRLVAALTVRSRPLYQTTLTWGLSADVEVGDVGVTTARVPFPVLSERVAMTPVDLEGSTATPADHVRVRVPPAALPIAEYRPTGAVLRARLMLNPSDAADFPGDGSLFVDLRFPDFKSTSRVYVVGKEDLLVPQFLILPHRCRPGRSCTVDVFVAYQTDNFRGGRLGLSPALEVILAYPLTREVPRAAGLELTVRGAA